MTTHKQVLRTEEALKLALEALEDALNKPMWNRQKMEKSISAIKEALAQPEQEPDDGYCKACDGWKCTAKAGCVALDNPPPQLKEPEQEPDDLTIAYMAGLSRGKDLAPQRTWVGLTDEEIEEIFNKSAGYCRDDFRSFARAIEAAHGIKGDTNE